MTLEILDWHDGDLLAKPVFDKLNELVAAGVPESKILGVTINTDEESDTDLWCPKYGIPFEITGNVVVVHTHKTRKAPPDFAAAFVTADTRADLNGVVKHTLEVSKVSFASIDAAVEATGMESGGMSPIGRCWLISTFSRFRNSTWALASARPNSWSIAPFSSTFPASSSSPHSASRAADGWLLANGALCFDFPCHMMANDGRFGHVACQ